LRILLDYRPALRQRTGVGEYVHELAAALRARLDPADTLTLFSSSWKDRLGPQPIPGAAVVDARVPVTMLNFAWHRLAWPTIETFAGDTDVAHSMHPLLMPASRAAQVVTIHDLYFLDNPEHTAAEIRRDYPALAGDHARRADAVVTVSQYTAGNIRSKLNVPAERISVCSPGAPPWAPLERHALDGPIVFMGTIEPRKNVGALLDAYAILRSRMPAAPPLLLAGNVSPACAAVLEPLSRPPLAGHARHVGYVSGDGREQLYRQASMIVLPSFDEGFGIPALEAMTIGIPVVASNRGALPEVVGDAGSLVDPEDREGLATAMQRLLADGDWARRCSTAGIAQSRRFSWAASASTLTAVYARAVERRRGRR
jgi:glycosyltransferase involved in cell wall biosynthesis